MELVVDFARQKNEQHVFSPNQSFSQLFERILARAGIEKIDALGHKLIAHSFRHTFKDACRAEGIENVISDALQGHSSGTVSGTYGTGYPLPVLAAAMAKVQYPGLALKRFHQ